MKSELNTGVVVAIVAAILIVICFGGYYLFLAPKASVSEEAKAKYMERMKGSTPMSEGTLQKRQGSPGSGGMAGSAGMPSSGGASPGSGGH